MQHIAVLTLVGLAVVGVFVISAGMSGGSRPAAARTSMAAWFVGSVANAVVGVLAGMPIVNELGAFLLIYGIPAGLALILSHVLKD